MVTGLDGYIKIHRTLLNWRWADDPNTLAVFIRLLLLARFVDGNWHGVELRRGQLIIGREKLAAQCGLSEQQVRTALRHLKSTGEITTKPTNKFTIITIVNYGKYQDAIERSTSRITSRSASNQPATNQQSTNKQPQRNNVNNVNPDDKDKNEWRKLIQSQRI